MTQYTILAVKDLFHRTILAPDMWRIPKELRNWIPIPIPELELELKIFQKKELELELELKIFRKKELELELKIFCQNELELELEFVIEGQFLFNSFRIPFQFLSNSGSFCLILKEFLQVSIPTQMFCSCLLQADDITDKVYILMSMKNHKGSIPYQ